METANAPLECPSCEGTGLVDDAVCPNCQGRGTVRRNRAAAVAINPPTTATPAGIATGSAARPATAPGRDDAAARLLRTLVESAENGEHMLDALQLLALSMPGNDEHMEERTALLDRVAENVRTRLGVASESKRSRKKRES